MFEASLFLGIPLSSEMQTALAELNPQLRDTFLQGGDNYLSLFTIEQKEYLGKQLGSISDTSRILLLKENVISLVKRLLPDCSISSESLTLLSQSASTL